MTHGFSYDLGMLLMESMIDNTIHNNCCVNKVRIQHRKQVNDDCRYLLICFRYREPKARRLLLLMVGGAE